MNLAWIRYVSKNKQQYALVVVLGERGPKLCVLKAAAIPTAEIMLIRKNIKKLTGMPIDDRIGWIRGHCPVAYRDTFRTLQANKTVQINTYDIGEFVDEFKKQTAKLGGQKLV
jgi:hypothetical protein